MPASLYYVLDLTSHTHARTHAHARTRDHQHAPKHTHMCAQHARALSLKTRTCYTHRRKHSGSHVQKRAHAMHTRPHSRTQAHRHTQAHTGTKVDIFGIETQMWERRINM